jgi:hypothetical protein
MAYRGRNRTERHMSEPDPVDTESRAQDLRAVHTALRSHELELNRATASFEHAVIAPLTVINGGAAAAWLAFVGNSNHDTSGVWAAGFWCVGLLLAVAAAFLGWRRQRAHSQAERLRREAWELAWLAAEPPKWSDLREVVSEVAFDEKTWSEPSDGSWQTALVKMYQAIGRGSQLSGWFQASVWGSAVLFVLGAIWAALSLGGAFA